MRTSCGRWDLLVLEARAHHPRIESASPGYVHSRRKSADLALEKWGLVPLSGALRARVVDSTEMYPPHQHPKECQS